MSSTLDALPPVLVAEHPGGEPGRLDRVVGTERRPVDARARLRGAAGAPLRLGHDLPRTLDPHAELLGAPVHPPPRPRRARAGPLVRHDAPAAAVHGLPV